MKHLHVFFTVYEELLTYPDPKICNVDHSFIFCTKAKNVVLFGGRVSSPSLGK